jgi:hypothetical protein
MASPAWTMKVWLARPFGLDRPGDPRQSATAPVVFAHHESARYDDQRELGGDLVGGAGRCWPQSSSSVRLNKNIVNNRTCAVSLQPDLNSRSQASFTLSA